MNDDLKNLQDKIDSYNKGKQDAQDKQDAEDRDSDFMNTGFRVGTELVVNIAAGVFVGYLLDKAVGTSPLFLILFFLTGFGIAMYRIYKITEGLDDSVGFKALQNDEKDAKTPPEGQHSKDKG